MLAVCAFRSCPFALAAHSGSLGHHERMVAEEVALSKDCVVQKWSRPANGTLEEEFMGKSPTRMAVFAASVVLIVGACSPAATTAPSTGPGATTGPAATTAIDR